MLNLDISLTLDLTLIRNGNIVHSEGMITRKEDTLVEADLESGCSDISQPQVDKFLGIGGVGCQFD